MTDRMTGGGLRRVVACSQTTATSAEAGDEYRGSSVVAIAVPGVREESLSW